MKVLALDYGSARTGVAVSDPTGTIARPIGVVERAASESGLARIAELVREEEAERVVVGLPLTLRGERGEQARDASPRRSPARTMPEPPRTCCRAISSGRAPQGSDAAAAAATSPHAALGHLPAPVRGDRRPDRRLRDRVVCGREHQGRRRDEGPASDDAADA
ncbi:MAG: Holliday junction resolvase RuvX [Actinobacteria bacterium]|nr:MAG: Holliday junction resolvase RuvX [Actinomycetota bacterium]